MAIQTIYVVFKTHFDIGFTELAEELVKRWDAQMFPEAFKACESTQNRGEGHRYVWTMPAWPLQSYLDRWASGKENADRAKALIAEKQIAWHALPFTTYTEFCGLEEYIRGMYFSRKLAREFGRRPVSAKMTDVLGHTWILPSLLDKAGVKFLHLGPNSACRLPEVPPLFFWEGPDGGRVLTFYNKAGGYGSTLTPPEGWPFPVWLALMQTNDNIGPQGPEVVDEILQRVEKEAPGSKVVIGSMDDFYNALGEYALDELPVVCGDIADTWVHGTGTFPDVTGRLRALRHTLTDLEKAQSLGSILGVFGQAEMDRFTESTAKAYENSLLFGEHTWGLNTLPNFKYERYYAKEDLGKNGDIGKMELSWDEHRNYYRIAQAEADRSGPETLNGIAASVDAGGPRLVVFNGLGWNRDAWADVDAFRAQLAGRVLADAESGGVLPTAELNGQLHVQVNRLPALGYKTLVLRDGAGAAFEKNAGIACDAANGLLENRRYRIAVDAKAGTIRSLIDKSTGHEWVGEYGQCGFAQYQYDVYSGDEATQFLLDTSARFYDWQVNSLVRKEYFDQKHVHSVPAGFSIEAVKDDLSSSLILTAELSGESVEKYGNARGFSLKITLYEDLPYIDLQYGLKDKEKTFCVEAGHFAFPLNLKDASYKINKLGSVVDPETDIVEGANHHLYCCENWMDASDGENGIAFIPLDLHLFSIGSHGILNFKRKYVKEDPILYFNAFNNSYGCNFPQWMGGDYSFRMRLMPHEGDWKQGNVSRLAFESVAPPLVGFSPESNGLRLPAQMELIRELDGMDVMCMKPAEDGAGILLRLRETAGSRRDVKLAFVKSMKSLAKCDLLEKVETQLEAGDGEIQLHTEPFEIHSFLIQFGC